MPRKLTPINVSIESVAEREEISRQARAAGLSISNYVRQILGLPIYSTKGWRGEGESTHYLLTHHSLNEGEKAADLPAAKTP